MKEEPKIGQLIAEAAPQRDAIHIAIAPAIAAMPLVPGQHVGLIDPNDIEMFGTSVSNHIGIVDPFLREPVRKGGRFWVFLYPGTVTALRHHWQHPGFAAAEVRKWKEERESRSL
jgi:hypothetical protein